LTLQAHSTMFSTRCGIWTATSTVSPSKVAIRIESMAPYVDWKIAYFPLHQRHRRNVCYDGPHDPSHDGCDW
jgi:hypothetical protein